LGVVPEGIFKRPYFRKTVGRKSGMGRRTEDFDEIWKKLRSAGGENLISNTKRRGGPDEKRKRRSKVRAKQKGQSCKSSYSSGGM